MLVSVIIPCYNVELYISECIESVINQTYKYVEIICIDNNSSDTTLKILKDLKIKYPQIIIDSEFKPGAPCARNKGLSLAKGEYIQFLDADDLLENNKIEHQILLVKNNNKVIGFIAGACKKRTLYNNEEIIFSELETDPFLSPFINKCGNTCSNLWKRMDLIEVGGWNESIKSSQETDLMLRLALKGKEFLVDKEPFTIIRERQSGQISHRDPESKWKQFIDVRLNYLTELKKSNVKKYEQYKNVFYDFLMVSVLSLSNYNREEALKIYQQSIKKHWKSSGNYGFGKLKVTFIKIMGFKIFLKLYRA